MEGVTTVPLNGNGSVFGNPNVTDDILMNGPTGLNQTDPLPLYFLVPVWGRHIAVIITVTMLVLGTIGNSVLVTVLIKKKQMESTDIYVTALAAGDVFSLFSVSLYNVSNFLPEVWISIGSLWLCKVNVYTQHVGFLASTLLILSIGVDRYLRVFRPSCVSLYNTARIVCLVVYLFSTVISMTSFFSSYINNAGACTYDPSYQSVMAIAYGISTIGATAFSIGLLCLYIRLAVYLKKRIQQLKKSIGIQKRAILNGQLRGTCRPGEANYCNTFTPNRDNSGRHSGQNPSSLVLLEQQRRARSMAKINVSLMLITFVYFISTVLPAVALVVYNSNVIKVKTEGVNLAFFFSIRLTLVGHVANPFLFLLSSSEYRTQANKTFKSFRFKNAC